MPTDMYSIKNSKCAAPGWPVCSCIGIHFRQQSNTVRRLYGSFASAPAP